MIKYRYAKNNLGEIIDIYNIDKIKNSNYTCIGCGKKLIPKTGTMRQHHFAHKSNTINCSKETYLHKFSKETLYNYLRYSIDNRIPFFLKYNRDICRYFENIICNSCKTQEEYNLLGYYQNVYLEKVSDNFVPDILLESKNKRNRLFIEIVVSHKSTEEKKENYKIIEIFIEDENDIFKIIKEGLDCNNKKISIINFKRNILHSEHCNRNDCINYIDCLQPIKNIVISRRNVFRFNELYQSPNNHIHQITKEEYDNNNNNIIKYLNNYAKEKKNIKTIFICKYNTTNNDYNYFLIIEMKK